VDAAAVAAAVHQALTTRAAAVRQVHIAAEVHLQADHQDLTAVADVHQAVAEAVVEEDADKRT